MPTPSIDNQTGLPPCQPVPLISGFNPNADFLMKTLLPPKCRRTAGPRMAQPCQVLLLPPLGEGRDVGSALRARWAKGDGAHLLQWCRTGSARIKVFMGRAGPHPSLPPEGEGVMRGRRDRMIRILAFFQSKKPFAHTEKSSIAMNIIANRHGFAASRRALA